MTDSKYPSESLDKFMLRFPDGMRERVKAEAARRGRSMNAEIINRLELSLVNDAYNEETLTAVQARSLLESTVDHGHEALLAKCFEEIKASVKQGYPHSVVDSTLREWKPTSSDEVYAKVIKPTKRKLEELGYTVELEGTDIFIAF
ncbi:MAG: Arc family DNA-binding protein [Pseudomonadales bacterium]|nr:Arc family DNA-binding protein [Pseudomonadales bacterium]NRA15181.1 Arc family DNA-binding protein [Oceanospirillaceae bacterium]